MGQCGGLIVGTADFDEFVETSGEAVFLVELSSVGDDKLAGGGVGVSCNPVLVKGSIPGGNDAD